VLELTREVGKVDITASPAVAGTAGTPFYFPNDGQTFIAFLGGAAAGDVMTFVSKVDKFGRDAAIKTFTVAAGKTGLVGPFDPGLWNNADGKVEFTLGVGKATDYYLAVRLTNSERNGA
jgi:hypothetical protein